MTDTINAAEFNALFGEALDRGGDSLDKVAAVTGLYIQDKLREASFARKILPPQTVTTAELTRNTTDEGLVYIDDIEPDSLAMQVNFRGEPSKTYIEGARYAIRISTVSSDRFQKSIQELRSYRMPIVRVIEQNTVKDIQEIQDKVFMEHVRVALMLGTRRRMNDLVDRGVVTHTGDDGISTDGKNFASKYAFASYLFTRNIADTVGSGGLSDTSPLVESPANHAWGLTSTSDANYNLATGQFSNIVLSEETEFGRAVLRDAIRIQSAREMKARCFLLHEFDWNATVGWLDSEAGLEVTSEIVRDGYKYSTVGGYTFVTTVRDNPDILQPGQIYTFPSPAFLGRFLPLDGTQFYINKEGRFMNMEAWEDAGVGFGNIKGIGMVLLAGAEVTLPTIWETEGGTVSDTSSTFRLVNDVADPVPA